MSSLSNLYYQLRKYRGLYDSVQDSIRCLDKVIDSSEMALKISDYYLMDDVSADNNSVKNTRTKFIEKKSFLSTTVLNAIGLKIREIQREIEELERAMAEAAAAQEKA